MKTEPLFYMTLCMGLILVTIVVLAMLGCNMSQGVATTLVVGATGLASGMVGYATPKKNSDAGDTVTVTSVHDEAKK